MGGELAAASDTGFDQKPGRWHTAATTFYLKITVINGDKIQIAL
jgi:hypothetical protein